MERLTDRTEKGHAYLVNVKPDEQEVDSPYKNTLQCILDCFERLAAYEETGLTPEQITEMQRQISDGTLVRVNERVIRDEYCQFNSNGTCSASACFAASVKCGAKDENGHPRYNWA